jgi:hypothetical protein
VRKCLAITAVLVLGLAEVCPAAASDRRKWAVDLHQYGYLGWVRNSWVSETRVAATDDVVTVALGNFPPGMQLDEQHGKWNSPMEVFLLFFNASNGKLKTKRGPWRTDSSFGLFSTSQGNFLLHLRHYHGATEKHGETLLLLSRTGEEIQKRELPGFRQNPKADWYEVLRSPTGSTILLSGGDPEGSHYQIFRANTLDAEREWTEAKGSPLVVALSDKELLGAVSTRKNEESNSRNRGQELFVRPLDGQWQRLPESFYLSHSGQGAGSAPDKTAFLADHLLAGLIRREEYGQTLKIVRSDGTVVISQKIDGAGEVTVSPDGRYFGLVYVSPSAFERWLAKMTDGEASWPHTADLSIWRVANPAPVAKLSLGRFVRNYCLTSDGNQFIYLDDGTLKAISVPVGSESDTPQAH